MGQFNCSTAFFDYQDPYHGMAKECQCDTIVKVVSGSTDGSCPTGTGRVPNEYCRALANSTLSDGTKLKAYKGNSCVRVAGTGCWYNAHRVVRGGENCQGIDQGSDHYAICQEALCSCTTPNAGTVGHNHYQCNDGSSGHCSETQVCYSTAPFPKGDQGVVCRDIAANASLAMSLASASAMAQIKRQTTLSTSCDVILSTYCEASHCRTCTSRRRHVHQPFPNDACRWWNDLFCCSPPCARQVSSLA